MLVDLGLDPYRIDAVIAGFGMPMGPFRWGRSGAGRGGEGAIIATAHMPHKPAPGTPCSPPHPTPHSNTPTPAG